MPDLGGMQWSIARLIKALYQRGHQVTILTRLTDKPEIASNCRLIRLAGDDIPTWTINSGKWLVDNHYSFDVIHVIDFFYQSIDSQLSYLSQVAKPSVFKIPTAGYVLKLINSERLLKLFNQVDAFVALNSYVVVELLAAGVDTNKIHRLPNGIDPLEFSQFGNKLAMRQSLGLPLDKVIILYVGRIVARKRLDVLVSAMKIVADNIQLVIVGSSFGQRDSTEEEIIKSIAESNGKITFIGAKENCSPYFIASDIQILVSEREGMPNSLLEGMSYSLPTIASFIPGITDLISPGVEGILVSVGNVAETAQAINMMAHDAALRMNMGALARQKIINDFNINDLAEKYELLYENLKNVRNGG